MGEISDIEDLLRKAKGEKRRRFLWAGLTSLGTIVSTTFVVSWTLNNYLHKAERENEKLRESILVMDKKLETLEMTWKADLKGIQADVFEARETANKALLYAQLTGGKKP
jgi:hypothetical protein